MSSVLGDIFDHGLGNTVKSEICKQIALKYTGEYTFMCDLFVYCRRNERNKSLFEQHS